MHASQRRPLERTYLTHRTWAKYVDHLLCFGLENSASIGFALTQIDSCGSRNWHPD